MAKISISELHNYIINTVRVIRLELDITQLALSKKFDSLSDTNLIGLVESEKTPTTYNDSHLNIIAKIFSEKAKQLGKGKSEYIILDFYPSGPLSEISVEKTIDSIPKNLQATGTLNLLLENKDPLFNEWRTVKEITDYCNEFAGKEWKTTDFTSVVARAEATQKLQRLGENEPKYKKA
ncbi:hypothetical protein [Mucilaginibacter sp.]|uniref:hypothetical protein n=1 Tax=Mucilaginibacter sp. TaxID=1882438 RepID=UPI003264A220